LTSFPKGEHPLRDIVVLMPDTGMRNARAMISGPYVLKSTGNLKAVMDSMGHVDVKTAMKYQHPELDIVRMAVNSRHILRHTGENGKAQTQP
jgi:hypothetical protein